MYHRVLAVFVSCAAGWIAATPAFAADEDQVKEAFKAFQAAIKAKDGDKLWGILDSSSQEAAVLRAKKFKDGYAKITDDKKKKEIEKKLGLTAAEMTDLSGKTYLKSLDYYGKYYEVPGGAIEKIAIDGKKATVFIQEEDGDKEKYEMVNQDGKWKMVGPPPQ